MVVRHVAKSQIPEGKVVIIVGNKGNAQDRIRCNETCLETTIAVALLIQTVRSKKTEQWDREKGHIVCIP